MLFYGKNEKWKNEAGNMVIRSCFGYKYFNIFTLLKYYVCMCDSGAITSRKLV